MTFDPFEGLGTPEEYLESFERDVLAPVVPCPECGKTAGWEPMGPHRCLCQGCGALVKNREVGRA